MTSASLCGKIILSYSYGPLKDLELYSPFNISISTRRSVPASRLPSAIRHLTGRYATFVLEANAKHLFTDVLTSMTVSIGVGLVMLTG